MQTFSGKQYLKIDVANTFGLDRLDWNDRLHWFDNNEWQLESIAVHAKQPILFRKAVRAFRTVQRGEPTNHVMGLDATASGIQIMAALSNCKSSCEATNLIDTGKRRDVYSEMANFMNLHDNVCVDRNDVKPPLMTVFYGSTAQPKKIFGEGEELLAFYKGLEEELRGPYELMELFQKHWQPHVTHHQWSLPDGHVAKVPVTQTMEKNLEIDEHEHMRFAYRAQVIMPKFRGLALAANIVHSIDGWIVRQMICAAKQQGFWLAPIHDCFYTSPKYMDNVRQNYATILAWISQSNLVSNILSQITGRLIPYKPLLQGNVRKHLGKQILDSNYALS